MHPFVHFDPATAYWLTIPMIIVGSLVMMNGVRVAFGMRRVAAGPGYMSRRMLPLIRGFGFVALGFCVFGVGLGWLIESDWLVPFALVFGLEERWEAFFLTGGFREVARRELRDAVA